MSPETARNPRQIETTEPATIGGVVVQAKLLTHCLDFGLSARDVALAHKIADRLEAMAAGEAA